MSAQAVFTSAVAMAGAALKPHGFRRRASKLTRAGDEVVSLIEFQRSGSSTAAALTFAVNYGVGVLSLLEVEGVDPAKLWWTQCHWHNRVSGIDGSEAWWPVRQGDDPERVAAHLAEIVGRAVLPALAEKQREADLVALWMTWRSRGLTDGRLLLCLGQLLHRAGRRQEAVAVRSELERLPEGPFTLRAVQKLRALEGADGE